MINGVETGKLNGNYTLPANAPSGYIDIPLDMSLIHIYRYIIQGACAANESYNEETTLNPAFEMAYLAAGDAVLL